MSSSLFIGLRGKYNMKQKQRYLTYVYVDGNILNIKQTILYPLIILYSIKEKYSIKQYYKYKFLMQAYFGGGKIQ